MKITHKHYDNKADVSKTSMTKNIGTLTLFSNNAPKTLDPRLLPSMYHKVTNHKVTSLNMTTQEKVFTDYSKILLKSL